jgi:hypothetical protein
MTPRREPPFSTGLPTIGRGLNGRDSFEHVLGASDVGLTVEVLLTGTDSAGCLIGWVLADGRDRRRSP